MASWQISAGEMKHSVIYMYMSNNVFTLNPYQITAKEASNMAPWQSCADPDDKCDPGDFCDWDSAYCVPCLSICDGTERFGCAQLCPGNEARKTIR